MPPIGSGMYILSGDTKVSEVRTVVQLNEEAVICVEEASLFTPGGSGNSR